MRLNHTITQEEFNKLPQLDRIELRQRRDWLEHNKVELGAFSFFWNMMIVLMVFMLAALILVNINKDAGIKLLGTLPLLIKLIFGFFIIMLALNLYFAFKHSKAMRELYAQYFDLKLNTRRKNGKGNCKD